MMSNLIPQLTALIRDKKKFEVSEKCLSDLLKGEVKKIKSLCLTTTVLGRYTDTFSSSLYQYQFRRKCQK